MNDRVTISVRQLFEKFPNQETARIYLESCLWPNGPVCPACQGSDRITVRKGGYYRCNACKLDFTIRTSTVFERSHIPLDKWLHAMYLLVTARKGISSLQLSKELRSVKPRAGFSFTVYVKRAETTSLRCTALSRLTKPTSAAGRKIGATKSAWLAL